MTSAVLFDLDGTFADTAPDLGAALNHLLNLHGLPAMSLEAIRPEVSNGSLSLLKLGFNVEPGAPNFTDLRDTFLEYYAAHICTHTTLFPGMAELVEALEGRGLPWGIVTNKPHRFTLPLIQALGYNRRASCLVSGDTCARAKPHPDPLLRASELLKVTPELCLYLGDDRRDAEAAQAARMRYVIARYGYVGPAEDLSGWPAQGCIDSPMQLLEHLTK
ncbi:MAG: phosphoglycolate phosphatase [Candidatus Nitrotoga sp.]|nr:phosphoglycolate phosphatase [Candidatus Nitrotoga sp.]MDW7604943.1 phosphoglycolate phosphatase [Candidatus Nitrotoga sp.]MDW7612876.1 phosphoglycolate phosphatase [Candidatus Nitrotoga sp.]MDW7625520.1 phosphoglycolate phosphatase [Candidatus Nitrotoga sp.]